MSNTFYIIRHGQTNWNILGKTQGHGNSDLTEQGVAQANELAEAMTKFKIDYIYSSDLGRAMETANIVAKELNLEVNQTKDLREMGFGEWEGLLTDQIKTDYADMYSTWRNEPHKFNAPGGENLNLIKERTDKFIKELNEKYTNKHIVLVSHSVTVRTMLLSFLGAGVENIYNIKQDNTALNIVEFKNYGPVVVKMNDTNHIKTTSQTKTSALE